MNQSLEVPERDEPLKQLAAELNELRSLLREMRAAMPLELKPGIARGARDPLHSANARIMAARVALNRVQAEVSTLEARLERAEHDAWDQKAKRADTTAKWKRAETLLSRIQSSPAWRLAKPLWKLLDRSRTSMEAAPPKDDFVFKLDAPTRWEIESEVVLVRGWCLSQSGREIAGVRGKIGKKGRIGRYGIERDDVNGPRDSRHTALRCGFTIEMPVPVGVSMLRLEAIVQGGEWEPFHEHEIKRTQTEADAALEGARQKSAAEKKQSGVPDSPRLVDISARRAAELLEPRLHKHAKHLTTSTPFFSIITPTFNTKPQWLAEAALSLLEQSVADWEWCIVDDGSTDHETRKLLEQIAAASPRVRTKFIVNSGISAATNEGLDLAAGEFVCFLDHDDLLAPNALEQMQQKVCDDFEVVYSDEDKLDDQTGKFVEPFFKPEWSPQYFHGAMYVGHLLCVQRQLAKQVRFNSEFDGVQDFEFMLRVSETGARTGHIDQVLYHWRKTPGSIAEKSDAKSGIDALQERAVNVHLQRMGLKARAETKLPHRLRIIPLPRKHEPRVSIIIPSRDAPELLTRCLGTLFGTTSYRNFEVLLIDNGSTDPDALQIMQEHPIRKVDFPGKFNFSRANNFGVREAAGEFVVFLNNDTEIISADWLQHLLYYAEQPDIGASGALLVYENRTVQHAGVALGMRGTADHTMRGFPLDVDGYAGSLACAREVSAVTAACMMMRKSLFEEIGGFNEHFFTAYQDLDLCLRLRGRGLRIIYTPESVLVHHESVSRQKYYDMIDRMLLLDQWEPVIEAGDPYYNRNLNLERGDYSPAHST
ncbi:MAG: glycosyltransferase family 2 protein [Chthoniobacterales bacterium]|nr:glycosyltransferase family 2 protein [Chthoniobacterales bacterium]